MKINGVNVILPEQLHLWLLMTECMLTKHPEEAVETIKAAVPELSSLTPIQLMPELAETIALRREVETMIQQIKVKVAELELKASGGTTH